MNEANIKEQVQSLPLRDQTKNRLIFGKEYAAQINAHGMVNLMEACLEKFDDLALLVDWDKPHTNGEINSVYGSLAAAIQYAYLQTGITFSPEEFFRERSSQEWSGIIDALIKNQPTQRIIVENMWRPPMVVIPQRAIPLQYILPFLFDGKEVRGVDLGAGLHVGLPMLNSEEFLDAEFPDKKIVNQSSILKMGTALGVDMQDRDLLWCQASLWPLTVNVQNFLFLKRCYEKVVADPRKYPFLKANILRDASKIKSAVAGQVDFVFSSFVRSQLGTDEVTQKEFMATVADLLGKDGVWVDIGELLKEEEKPTRWAVNVYRKRDSNSLEKIGTPFFLGSNQRDIVEVNKIFFCEVL